MQQLKKLFTGAAQNKLYTINTGNVPEFSTPFSFNSGITFDVKVVSNQLMSTMPRGAQKGAVVPSKGSSTVPSVRANPYTSGGSSSTAGKNSTGLSNT